MAAEVDTLRRAIGSAQVRRIPPHVTLVPPVNVATDDVGAVLEALAAAARPTRPFRLTLGPAASFAPATPTVHLAVRDEDGALPTLRDALSVGPLGRPDPRPFVPHVTLDPRVEPARVEACLPTLRSVELDWSVETVVLLEHLVRDDGPPVWVPVAEEPFGGPAVVGRGGLELALRATSVVAPEVAELLGPASRPDPGAADPAVRPLVVTARRRDGTAADGDLAGAAVGEVVGPAGPPASARRPAGITVARLGGLTVAPEERGLGVGAHLLARWCAAAAALGADLALASAGGEDGDPGRTAAGADDARAFLERHGFRPAAGAVLRRL